jgi:predicted  nucleic acid-binding Zn-ribbon protein
MGFEAEFELCGSTCTCPGCGGLFLVPEVDQAALEAAQNGPQAPESPREYAVLDGPGAGVFLELARLKIEVAEARQRHRNLEDQLEGERARASKETALVAELREALGAQKKADVRAKDLDKQLKGLQAKLDEAEAKLKALEDTAAVQRRDWDTAGDQLRTELAAALQAAERAKQALDQPSQEVAKLRGELETVEARGRSLEKEIASERERSAEQLVHLRKELEKAVSERALGEAKVEKLELAKRAGDSAQRELEKEVQKHRTALEEAARQNALEAGALRKAVAEVEAKVQALETERDGARTSAKREVETLQKQLSERKADSERSALAVAEAVKESERLRSELSGVKAEKWSAERGFAEEHERLLERLRSVEVERDTIREDSRLLARSAAEPDGELERLRGELSAALAASSNAERALGQERTKLTGRLEILEQAKEAAGERARGLVEELSGLRRQLELANKNLEAQKTETPPAPGLSPEAEAELRQILAKRDLEIQRLASQIRDASHHADASSPSNSLLGWMNGKVAFVLPVLALAIGLLSGAALSRRKAGTVNAPEVALKTPPAHGGDSEGGAQGAPGPVSTAVIPSAGGTRGAGPTASSGSAAVTAIPQAPAAAGSLAASRAGMPSPLPDQFLGIRFGTELGEVAGIAQWKETAGKRHRKAELLGSEVEAVLTTDGQNRLIMGSYVRVASRQAEALTPFLEWAVNVQDAVSALYGEPIRVHSVEGATDAVEVVRKIAAGEDFYQATWEREVEDGMIDLSIRVFNERSVVFRMEYRARQLYVGFVEGQTAKDGAKEVIAPVQSPGKVE